MFRRAKVLFGLAAALLVSPVYAQGIPHRMSYQGALLDAQGFPVADGNYSMTFRLYDAPVGGTLLWQETRDVPVVDGRFNVDLGATLPMPNPCPPGPIFDGDPTNKCDSLYLASTVGGGGEATPRSKINSALTSLSAERLVGTVLTGEGWAAVADNTGDYLPRTEIVANSGEQVIRMINAVQDTVFRLTPTELKLGQDTMCRVTPTWLRVGDVFDAFTIDGANGRITSNSGTFDFDNDELVTTGKAAIGNSATSAGYQLFVGGGIHSTMSGGNPALYAQQLGAGPAIVGYGTVGGGGDLIQLKSLVGFSVNTRFAVSNAGNVCADGTITQLGGCDVAENMRVTGDLMTYGPGDVLALSATEVGALELAAEPYCKRVAGIYSTQPGFHLAANAFGESSAQVPVALNGVVPCKVSAENGPIAVGDLLVSSSMPGYAMRASDPQAAFGAVIGKAMEPLATGAGTIRVLVSLQ